MEFKLTNLTKDFKEVRAVDAVSCSLNTGVYGLLGANGAGKTTLMRMICTLLNPNDGGITLDGRDIFSLGGDYRRILGYLPQDFGYYPDFTVNDYLMYIASIKGLTPSVAKQRRSMLLEQVGLTAAAHKKMKKLSGGMKRRVGIAQAMLNDPKILVLDEPTAGLDPKERVRFRNLISELAAEKLVLLSTHIVSDVESIAKEILLMKHGQLLMQGTTEQLLAAMEGAVWHCAVAQAGLDAFMTAHKVVNIKTVSGGAELRVLSRQKPTAEAVAVSPTLEDVFFNYADDGADSEEN